MQHKTILRIILLFILIFPSVWSFASSANSNCRDGHSQIQIKEANVQGDPVDATSIYTPNGVNFYIPHTGNYLITFTLENGDEYFGEFEVTD